LLLTSSGKLISIASPTSVPEKLLRLVRQVALVPALALTPPAPILPGFLASHRVAVDPVWLGLIAPPSSAKTELLNSISGLPHVIQAATVTPSGLLSGTPDKQKDKGARGGLLRQIDGFGGFGIICLKDFGSILSMHAETRAETLAALREVYDGAWTRHLGSAGGKTLSWKGKSRPDQTRNMAAINRHFPGFWSRQATGSSWAFLVSSVGDVDTRRDRRTFRHQCPGLHQWGRLDHGKYQLDPKTLSLANAAFVQARASSCKASCSFSLLAFEACCRASLANS
jgi:hypothetical protein